MITRVEKKKQNVIILEPFDAGPLTVIFMSIALSRSININIQLHVGRKRYDEMFY